MTPRNWITPEPAGIYLQAHGHPVYFKNVWIVEKKYPVRGHNGCVGPEPMLPRPGWRFGDAWLRGCGRQGAVGIKPMINERAMTEGWIGHPAGRPATALF